LGASGGSAAISLFVTDSYGRLVPDAEVAVTDGASVTNRGIASEVPPTFLRCWGERRRRFDCPHHKRFDGVCHKAEPLKVEVRPWESVTGTFLRT
jgi:hypothetical protein